MLSHGIVIGEQCPYCTRFRSPRDIVHMPGGAKICGPCIHRHNEALEALSTGEFNGECSECGKTAEQLRSKDGRMAVHFENGYYRMMCLPCNEVYVMKRAELYGQTEYGQSLGLDK